MARPRRRPALGPPPRAPAGEDLARRRGWVYDFAASRCARWSRNRVRWLTSADSAPLWIRDVQSSTAPPIGRTRGGAVAPRDRPYRIAA